MRRIFALLLVVLSVNFLILPASSALADRASGIDVSHYQGTITASQWTQVFSNGKTFAWSKADESNINADNDSTFVNNMINGRAAGLYMGAYHFARPEDNSDATIEAAHFLSVVQPNGPSGANNFLGAGYFRPMLDIETDAAAGATYLSNWINTFCNYIVAHGGGPRVEPLVYMNSNYASNYVNSSVTGLDLDVASYGTNPSNPPVPTGNPSTGVWPTWAYWQYGSKGVVPGISGNVDMDVANGDINFVKQFVIGGNGERFDVNGTVANSGVVNNGTYSWESAGFSTTADGTDPAPWADGNFLRLAAGTDAGTSNYTITANSNHTFAGMMLQTGGGGTVTISGLGILSIASGDQGMYVSTSTQTLKINSSLGGTGRLVWQGSGGAAAGGSLYLLGGNTYTGGTLLNSNAGLNFNSSHSFGTGLITWGTAQQLLADDLASAPITLSNAMATRAASQLIYVGPAAAPVTFSGGWALASGSSELTIGNATHTSTKMTISGNISGSGGALVKDGVGTLVLSGANSYNGGTTLNAGTLLVNNTTGTGTGTGSVTVSAGTFLGGTGTIQGAVTNSGTVGPGATVGTLHLGSTYSQDSGARLEIDLASSASHDGLVVTGAASLAGTLAVSLVSGFVPQEGNLFEVLTASGFGGSTFASISLPTLSGSMAWKVNYGPTALTLSVLLPGDFNGDGTVDTSDYVVWLKNLGQPAGTLSNDTTGVAIGDSQYNLWRTNFGGTSGSGSGSGSSLAQTAVPEPCAMTLGVIGGAVVTLRRGRRRRVL